ncbi:hypothetical protein OQA88_12833 [Cercophora sp. LCS_1]
MTNLHLPSPENHPENHPGKPLPSDEDDGIPDSSSFTTTTPFTDASSRPPSPSPSPSVFWSHPHPLLTRDATPWPGQTYILLHLPTHRALCLSNGKPILVPPSPPTLPSHTGNWHWAVTETVGYLGLRNCASGTYLGRNFGGGIEAMAGHHRWWEYFCARRHPEGGYVLLNANCVAQEMEKVGLGEDGGLRLGCDKEARWEFVRVL